MLELLRGRDLWSVIFVKIVKRKSSSTGAVADLAIDLSNVCHSPVRGGVPIAHYKDWNRIKNMTNVNCGRQAILIFADRGPSI